MAVTGCNFVRFTRHGLQSVRHAWPRTRDRFILRRYALKLRFWDERHLHPPGVLLDHTYESVKSLPGSGVYELRVDDDTGGQANIRVVFFDPPRSWVPNRVEERPLPIVWVVEVLPKRRNEWTANDVTRFRASRLLIQRRFYSG